MSVAHSALRGQSNAPRRGRHPHKQKIHNIQYLTVNCRATPTARAPNLAPSHGSRATGSPPSTRPPTRARFASFAGKRFDAREKAALAQRLALIECEADIADRRLGEGGGGRTARDKLRVAPCRSGRASDTGGCGIMRAMRSSVRWRGSWCSGSALGFAPGRRAWDLTRYSACSCVGRSARGSPRICGGSPPSLPLRLCVQLRYCSQRHPQQHQQARHGGGFFRV